VEAVRIGKLRLKNHLHCALRDLIVSQIQSASPVPMFVALPEDSRGIRVAQAFLADPAAAPSLDVLCGKVGVGMRTIQRSFRREVGTSFEFWRRQVRLTKGIELLLEGYSVKAVAAEVGYRHPIASSHYFDKPLVPPQKYGRLRCRGKSLEGDFRKCQPTKDRAMFAPSLHRQLLSPWTNCHRLYAADRYCSAEDSDKSNDSTKLKIMQRKAKTLVQKLSYSRGKEHVSWIESAKTIKAT